MRLTLKLYIDRFSGNMLPLNYHYELASAIYKIMSQYETEYATWLHECGYSSNGKKQFKLFNYTDLYIPKYLINGDRMEVLSDYACWEISFLLPEGIYNFIHGVLEGQCFRVADKISGINFRITDITLAPTPELKETMRFRAISPICVSQLEPGKPPVYLSPEAIKYADAVLYGLLSRYEAAYGGPYTGKAFCGFNLLSVPKSVLITIKANTPQQTKVRGYRYDFEITLPIELMRLLYDCGIGEKNSMGFGMIKII